MINNVVLVGRLVKDPELRKVQSGNSVCNFTLAVDNLMKGPDGNTTTSFISCVAWNRTAENVAKFSRKGMLTGVEGSLVQRSYDRKDGTKGYVIEIICNSVTFLESKPKEPAETIIDPNEEIKKQEQADAKKVEETHNVQEMDNDSVTIPNDGLPF